MMHDTILLRYPDHAVEELRHTEQHMILGVGTSEDPRKSTKQEFWPLGVGKSEMPPGYAISIHALFKPNTVCDSSN